VKPVWVTKKVLKPYSARRRQGMQGKSSRSGYLRVIDNGRARAISSPLPSRTDTSLTLAPVRRHDRVRRQIGGNHVNLDPGGGVYAIYAHLQLGSIRVKLGDKVTPGQVIALLGNSGHAGEPHLHFQLMDRNSLLNSDGLPYYFTGFKLTGQISGDSEGQPTEAPANLKVNRLPAPEAHHGDIPLENEVVDFEP
jgi:murein DD-endopeptidase MepM/ murein hydrolase activator NlpD